MKLLDIEVFIMDHVRFAKKTIRYPCRSFGISRDISRARADMRKGGAPAEWQAAQRRYQRALQQRASFGLWA